MSLTSRFEVMKKIGTGAYASVKQVKRKIDGQIYALKMVRLPKLSKKGKKISNHSNFRKGKLS